MSSLTTMASNWFTKLHYSDLPPDIVRETQRAILNTLAVATAASGLEYGPPVQATARDLGGGGRSVIFGFGDNTSVTAAAFANATLVSSLAYDDSHTETLIHVYGTIVSTVLSMAAEHSLTGQEALTIIAGASELTCRVGVIAPTAFHRQGLHPTGIIGAFGAAFAAAHVLQLDANKMVHALGIVGNMASGINQCWVDGTWSQLVDNGWAAQAGITAATLAKHGYTGPSEVLEGPLGLFHSHIPDKDYVFNFSRMTDQLGSLWEMREIEIKPYPCGHVSQPFVDCILDLHQQGLRSENVETLTCLVADWMVPVVCEPIERKKRPTSAWHGRVSLPYTIAEGLHFGQLNAASYRTENLSSPELLALIDKIEYQIDQTAVSGRNYKGWIKAVDKNGKAYEAIKFDAPDSNRSMSESNFLRKITNCFKLGAKQTNLDALQSAVAALPQASSLRDLLNACEALTDHA